MSVNSKMTAIADAIRSKTGLTGTLTLDGMADAVNGISTGTELPELSNPGTSSDLIYGKEFINADGEKVTGTLNTYNAEVTPTKEDQYIYPEDGWLFDEVCVEAIPSQYITTTDATAAAADIRSGETAYVNGSKVTGTMPTATQATPSVTVSSSGLITASATQSAGYIAAGTKSGTKQLTTQAAKTITPSKSSQTAVASGRYTTGAITVAAIPSQYITTTDATAAAADIRSGKTAYVNGSKRTGTIADFDGSYTCSGESTGGGGSGGGASIETCTVTIGNASQTVKCCYTDANMTIQNCIGSKTITVPQNTLLFCLEPTTHTSFYVSGNCQIEFSNFTMMCLKVHGDCSIAAHAGTESGGS